MACRSKLTVCAVCVLVWIAGGCTSGSATTKPRAVPSGPDSPSKDKPPPVPSAAVPHFPWPPPAASAQVSLPDDFLRRPGSTPLIRDIDKQLVRAFDATGFVERSYFAVPDGFALVTRLEQFNEDGTSKKPPARWDVNMTALQEFSIGAYVKALFKATPGHYRILVFVVTPVHFHQSDAKVSQEEGMAWLPRGNNSLPGAIADHEYSPAHKCTVLIYEFEQPDVGEAAKYVKKSRLSGQDHLDKADLWRQLNP